MDSLSLASSCWLCNRPDYGTMDNSIPDLVAATLTELGLPTPANLIQTMLMHDGFFVGWKYRYDGGYAIWWAGDDTIELYDEQGTLLKALALEDDRGAAA